MIGFDSKLINSKVLAEFTGSSMPDKIKEDKGICKASFLFLDNFISLEHE